MIKNLLILFSFLFFLKIGFSQQCFDYHKSCKLAYSKFEYSETRNSVSFLFKAGETKELQIPVFSGKDYRISLCADSVFNQIVALKFINSKGNILYDNSEHNYELNLEFVSKQTQIAVLEISVPDIINPNGTIPKGCIGIRIEDMVSVKLGF